MAEALKGKRIGDYIVSKDELGRGSYGKVYLGSHVRTRKLVAAKKLTREKEYVTEESDKEADVMMSIPDNENVVKILDYMKFDHQKGRKLYVKFWLIVEYCTLGSLEDFAENKRLSVCEKVDLAGQCARAVHHLHFQVPSFIHRDIKPKNILVAGSPDKPVAKLADLGCARLIEIKDGRSVAMNSIIGSYDYNAPELFSDSRLHTKSVDVFALGATFLAVVEAETKIKVIRVGRECLGRYLHHGQGVGFTYNIHKSGDSDEVQEMKNVLAPMLAKNKDSRPGIQTVLQSLDYLLIMMRACQVGFPKRLAEELLSRQAEVTGAEGGARAEALALAPPAEPAPAPAPVPVHTPAPTPTSAPAPAPAPASSPAPAPAVGRATSAAPAPSHAPAPAPTPTPASAPSPAKAPAPEPASAPIRAQATITPSRNINWETARVTAAGNTQMPDGTSEFVAFDHNGAAVLADYSHIFLYSHNSTSSTSSPSHSLTGKIPFPSGVRSDCYTAITDTTLAVQQYENDPTFMFRRSDRHQLSTLHHPGALLGALGDHLVYAKNRSTGGGYIISVHRAGDEMILEPPAGRTWREELSVCMTSRYITVVESETKSLDVFSSTGKHISYRRLQYKPHFYSSITACGHSHVIVAQYFPPALHIHQLPGGEVIRSISGAELGLREYDDYVWAVQYSEQGIIHLLTYSISSGTRTFSLRTYKVTE